MTGRPCPGFLFLSFVIPVADSGILNLFQIPAKSSQPSFPFHFTFVQPSFGLAQHPWIDWAGTYPTNLFRTHKA